MTQCMHDRNILIPFVMVGYDVFFIRGLCFCLLSSSFTIRSMEHVVRCRR